jgi:quinoprotein glucose dehydrogenase
MEKKEGVTTETQRHREGRHQIFVNGGLLCVFVSLWLLPLLSAQSPRSTWDGIFNEEQAKRGQGVFLEECSNCHGRDLEGADMTPPLTGGGFTSNWDGLTLGDLSDRIRISMPLNSPGKLSRQQNTDVIAYILRFNQFPIGTEELPRDAQALKQILFKAAKP